MKNRFYWFILYGICNLLFFACQDENESPIIAPPSNVDAYSGSNHVVTLQDEMEGFHYSDFTCMIQTEDGTHISRKGKHLRLKGQSILTFQEGLKEGIYRLLSLKAPVVGSEDADTTWVEHGLGCRVAISEDQAAKVLDAYSKAMRLSGSGTEEDPFIISSSDHLKRLRDITNDQIKNNLLLEKTHFLQVADIDLDRASWDADHEFGWLSIGNLPNNPFRGIYDGGDHAITNLWAKRPHSAGIALFGYTATAVLKNIRLENPRMEGNYAVGSLVGAVVTAGNKREKALIIHCTTDNGYIQASDGSVGAGGLVGVVDMHGMCLLDSCTNKSTSVSGDYATGGLLGMGSMYSQVTIKQSFNHGEVSANYTGAGGMVGTSDSLYVVGCANTASILGGKLCAASDLSNGGFGTGGIAGGSGVSYIYASSNSGDVTGCVGVGGIIGSTRVGAEDPLFSNTLTKSCSNTGAVTGETAVGGICGEAQFGCYAVYNTGDITVTTGESHVGGIVGNTSIAVVHNALNTGKIVAPDTHCAGGVIGKTNWGAVFACQNLGNMSVKADYAGGVIGLAGNYTMVNYCYNGGFIQNSGNDATGGIVGEIGDPREWSAGDIMSCVIGSVECVLAFVGPMISAVGTAVQAQLKAAEGTASTLTKAFGKLTYVLHVGECGLEHLLWLSDACTLVYGVYGMLSEEEIEMLRSSLNANVTVIDQEIREQMANLRNNHSLAADLLPSKLNSGIAGTYMQHADGVLKFYEASNDHTNVINFNINNKREERFEEIEQQNKIQAITHKAIAGVCLGVTAVAVVGSSIATAGTSAAALLALAGATATFIGGMNAVIEGATDFQNNVVIVSQCVNMGTMQADQADHVGGIVGHLEQHGQVLDCVNASAYVGTSKGTGGVIGRASSNSEIYRCLSTGKGWKSTILHSYTGSTYGGQHRYYKDAFPDLTESDYHAARMLSAEELCNAGSYTPWDINNENSIWKVSGDIGSFPLPFRSEMQEEVKEEE